MLGAASPLTAGLLAGSPREARVLAGFPTAVYLGADSHHDVIPVLTCDALMLPTAARLPLAASAVDFGVEPGHTAMIGNSEIRLGAMTIRLVRAWRPSRVRIRQLTATAGTLHRIADGFEAHGLNATLAERTGAVLLAALLGDAAETGNQVRRLLGAGQGLTPSGDDALCAAALVLHGIAAAPAAALLGEALAAAWDSTTSLSASLLAAARQGYAVPQVAGLLDSALRGDAKACLTGAAPVLAIGHSSGRDLMAGLTGCLRVLADFSSSASAARAASSVRMPPAANHLTGRTIP